jgi:hypothetical protein
MTLSTCNNPHRVDQRCSRLLTLMAALFFAGCGSGDDVPLYPLRGTATYRGQPIPRAELVFHPQRTEPGWMPVAIVADDGSFAAGTKHPGDGAPAGRYKVTASWYRDATDENPGRNHLPAHYSDATTTPLEIEVRPDSEEMLSLPLTD